MASLLRTYLPENLKYLARDRRGTASIESALLAALIAVVLIAAVAELGSKVAQMYDSTAQLLEQTVNVATGECGLVGSCGNTGGNTGGAGPGTGAGDGNSGKDKDKGKRKRKKKDRDRGRGRGRDRDRD